MFILGQSSRDKQGA